MPRHRYLITLIRLVQMARKLDNHKKNRNGIKRAFGSAVKKKYERSSLLEMKYKGLDLVLKTDREGNATTLFIGKKKPDGNISGERYVRTLKHDKNGALIKDHWELKGKVT
jgi:hypothetical protein